MGRFLVPTRTQSSYRMLLSFSPNPKQNKALKKIDMVRKNENGWNERWKQRKTNNNNHIKKGGNTLLLAFLLRRSRCWSDGRSKAVDKLDGLVEKIADRFRTALGVVLCRHAQFVEGVAAVRVASWSVAQSQETVVHEDSHQRGTTAAGRKTERLVADSEMDKARFFPRTTQWPKTLS